MRKPEGRVGAPGAGITRGAGSGLPAPRSGWGFPAARPPGARWEPGRNRVSAADPFSGCFSLPSAPSLPPLSSGESFPSRLSLPTPASPPDPGCPHSSRPTPAPPAWRGRPATATPRGHPRRRVPPAVPRGSGPGAAPVAPRLASPGMHLSGAGVEGTSGGPR